MKRTILFIPRLLANIPTYFVPMLFKHVLYEASKNFYTLCHNWVMRATFDKQQLQAMEDAVIRHEKQNQIAQNLVADYLHEVQTKMQQQTETATHPQSAGAIPLHQARGKKRK